MNPLNLKLFRDLWHNRGQVIAIAIVVACGIASFVMAMSSSSSITLTQATWRGDMKSYRPNFIRDTARRPRR